MANCGRIRNWATEHGIVQLIPDCSVLQRYQHGGDIALGILNRVKKGGAGKKPGKVRIKHLLPPVGGWK